MTAPGMRDKGRGGEENKAHLIWECIPKSGIPKTLSHAFSFQSRAKDPGSSGPGKGIAQYMPRLIWSLCHISHSRSPAGRGPLLRGLLGVPQWLQQGSHTHSQHPNCLQMWTLQRGMMVRNWVSVEKRNKGRRRKRKANLPCSISYYFLKIRTSLGRCLRVGLKVVQSLRMIWSCWWCLQGRDCREGAIGPRRVVHTGNAD